MKKLSGKRIAILAADGVEEVELTSPRQALEEEGAIVEIVSPQTGKLKAWKNGSWSIEINIDENVEVANPDYYEGLVIPGGVINPDTLRVSKKCIAFATHFMQEGKPIASICHGPQLLIETGLLQGKNMTSYYSIKTDLMNAGANWQDKEVVTDQGLVTSRSPEDLDAFNQKMIEEFGEGIHKNR